MKIILMCELSISVTLKEQTKQWTTATNIYSSTAPLMSFEFYLLILLLYEGCSSRNGPLNTSPKAQIKSGRIQSQ
jgi:hypothetical protein